MVKQFLSCLCFPGAVRIIGLALAGVLAATTPSWAQFGGIGAVEQAAPRSVPSFPRPTAAEARILLKLAESTSVDWTDKSFEEAVNDLEAQHGVEIWLDKQAMQDQGIDTEQQVTLKMKDISLRTCLRLTLEPLGLVYVIEDEVMKITSQVAHGTKMTTRVYPVGDLCETPAEAKELLETIECGLGISRRTGDGPRYVISSKMKTLTVRDSYTAQEKVQELILALRDAQAANNPAQPVLNPGS